MLSAGVLAAGVVGLIPTAEAASVKSDTLIIAESAAPLTFDPTQSDAISTWYPWALAYDSLFRVKKDGSYAPMLAKSWTISADRLTYTFKLRSGVSFHNGDLFTADDVVFSYERLIAKGIPYVKARFATLTSIKAIDDMKVQLQLSAPDAGFMNNLGDPFEVGVAILSRKAAAKTNPATKMIGTGPYEMVGYTPDQSLTLVRNNNYWGTKAKTENLKILYMPDQNAQVAAIRANKIDLMFPSVTSVKALEGSKVAIKQIQTAIIIQLEINSEFNPALSKLKVRQAIAHAIDRKEIVSKALLGAGVPSTHIPSSLKYAVRIADLPTYTFNPELSKQLLDDAGYSKGLDITLDVFATAPPEILRFAQVIQSQLKVVGINVTIVNGDFATWLAKFNTGKFAILANWTSYKADPIWYLKVRPGRSGTTPLEIAAMEAKIQGAQQKDIPSLLSEYEKLQASVVWPNLAIAAEALWVATNRNVLGTSVENTMSRSFLTGVSVYK